jgi:hypothetical protein
MGTACGCGFAETHGVDVADLSTSQDTQNVFRFKPLSTRGANS